MLKTKIPTTTNKRNLFTFTFKIWQPAVGSWQQTHRLLNYGEKVFY